MCDKYPITDRLRGEPTVDDCEEAAEEIERLRAELQWYGHTIAGGGPIRGYQRAAQIAENRWYYTTLKMLAAKEDDSDE